MEVLSCPPPTPRESASARPGDAIRSLISAAFGRLLLFFDIRRRDGGWRAQREKPRLSVRERFRRGGAGAVVASLVIGLLSGGIVLTTAAPASAATIERGTIYGLDWNNDGTRWIWTVSETGQNTHLFPITQVPEHPWIFLTNALAVNVDAGEFYFAGQDPNLAEATFPIYRADAATETTTWMADIPLGPLSGIPTSGAFNGVYDPSSGIYYIGFQSGSTGYIYGYNVTTNTALGVVATIPVPAGDGNIADFAIDSTGRLYYVTDISNDTRPRTFIVTNERLPITGSSTPPMLTPRIIATGSTPAVSAGAVAFGSDGYLYVGMANADRMDRTDPSSGAIVASFPFSDPSATIADFASDVLPNTIEVFKNLPDGRVLPTDQFGVSVTGGGLGLGNTGVTEGTETGLQNQSPAESAGPVVGLVGTTYTVAETAAGTTVLGDYDPSWVCVNANAGDAVIASGTGPIGQVTMPETPITGTRLVCTFTNAEALAPLALEKTSTATTATRQGDTVTYTVTATNTGTTDYTAENPAVVLDDLSGVLDDGTYNGDAAASQTGTLSYAEPLLSWTGPLAAGASVELTYTVTLANTGDGDVRNVAWQPNDPSTPVPPACEAPVNGVDPVTGEPCATVEYPLPRLSIDKSADRTDLPAVGETATYTVVVTNEGPGAYTVDAPATMTDDLTEVLDDATFDAASLTASTGSASLSGSTLSWSGVLAAGESATITYSVTYTGDGDEQLLNNACVPTDQVVPGQPPCDSVVIPGSGLQQWKSATPSSSPVVAGSTITYTLFFDNDGLADATVDAIDDLTSVLDDATVTVEPSSPDGLTVVRNGTEIAITGTVPVGQTSTVTYTVTALPDDQRGDSVATNFLLAPGETPPGECDPAVPAFPDCTSTPITGVAYTKSVVASDDPVIAGTELTYTVTITNTGATPVDVVRDDNLAGVLDDATLTGAPSSDTASVTVDGPVGDVLEIRGTLDVGATAEVTYTVTVAADDARGDDVAANFLVNPGETPPATCDPATEQCTVTPIQAYTVAKSADVESAVPGDVVTYTVTVVNTGGVAFTDANPATFTDDLSAVLDDATYNGDVTAGGSVAGSELSWSGALAVGASATVTYSVTVNDPDAGDGMLTNAVVPTTPGGECDPAAECSVDVPVASYTVQKSVDTDSAMAGDVVTYTVTVTNTSEVDFTDAAPVTITDDLSGVLDDATYNNDVSAGGSIAGTTLTWSGALPAGGTAEVTYSVTVNDPLTGDQSMVNVVVPGTPGGDCVTADDCTTTTPIASYTVSKVASTPTVQLGGTVTYEVTVTNTGDVDYTAAAPASFTDDLSAVLDDASYNDDATGGATVTGNTLAWSGAIAVGESATITYSVTVNDPDTGDYVLTNAVVPTGSGGTCAPNEDCTTTTPVQAFRVTKTADATEVVPGDVITYTITVENTGQVAYTDAAPAALTDDLSDVLDDATYNADASGGAVYAAPVLSWSGALGIGETATITYSVTVNDPATGDNRLDNAVVTENGGNCADGSNDPACMVIIPSGSYTVSKAVSATSALPGDVVTYTVTVTNTGEVAYTTEDPASFEDSLANVLDDAEYNDDATNGAVVDGTTLSWSGALAVGESITVTYSVTVHDAGDGAGDLSLDNVVVPTSPGGDCDPAATCETSTPIAQFQVSKTSNGAGEVRVGDTVTYTVTVTNNGAVDFTDAVPASFTDDLSAVVDDATYNGDASSGAVVDGSTLSWSGPLAIGASIDVTYSVTVVAAGSGDGVLTNAVVPGDPGTCVNSCSTEDLVRAYTVVKAVDKSVAEPGDRVTYTVTVRNTGAVAFTADDPASFTDDLTKVLDDASWNGDASTGVSYEKPTLFWSGALPVGGTVTVTYSVTINNPLTGDHQLWNAVTPGEDGSCAGTCSTLTTVVKPGTLPRTGADPAAIAMGLGGGVMAILAGLVLVLLRRKRAGIDAE